jgi:hypothetical protein
MRIELRERLEILIQGLPHGVFGVGVAAAERQLQRIVVGAQHHVAGECLVGFDAAG